MIKVSGFPAIAEPPEQIRGGDKLKGRPLSFPAPGVRAVLRPGMQAVGRGSAL